MLYSLLSGFPDFGIHLALIYGTAGKALRQPARLAAAPAEIKQAKLLKPGKEPIMTEEMTILSDGVLFDELEVEEMEEVVAPGVAVTN